MAMRITLWLIVFLLIVFIVPSLAHMALWTIDEKPENWRQARWSSAGILRPNPASEEAHIYVFSARTGGLKGAFSTHSWIVLKPLGQQKYDRYEVVGWGKPVRKNAYDADAYWYSNLPVINYRITGKVAGKLIPQIEQAIADYSWNKPGDYVIWPGPNSNTFVATVLRSVPDLTISTPSTAVGRDFPVNGNWVGRHHNGDRFATLGGYAGIVIGGATGLELNFLGLVAGINPYRKEILVPSFGAFRF